jgi:3D (Asp-Asp-Asp) domain-containing protein/murein DD-endopeptidase MepM/ murein hydrolase activator NlpD
MKIVQTSDYIIYFDNVRVDPYVLSWNTTLGLSAGEAGGSVTMYKSASLMRWKAFLTQVRIFVKNIFTGKYAMVFEGEITNRSWDDSRADSGRVSYQLQGFFHWLNIPIPLMVNTTEALNSLKTFEFEAQGINVNAVSSLFKNQEEISLRNKTIKEIVDYLFEKMNQGYYNSAQDDSTFAWSAIKERFKVMVDINKSYRSGGFLDIFTLINSTQVQTFYVYLNEILSQMMFEFYQDRDGAFRIKNPSWADDILKNHIIDESLVARITGMDNWAQEPTRVLAIGGSTDLYNQSVASGANPELLKIDSVPVGLYIGDAQPAHKKDERYYSAAFEGLRQQTGLTAGELANLGGTVETDQWFDNIAGNYAISSKFTGDVARTDVKGKGTYHRGTDYAVPQDTPLRNLGTFGKVISAAMDSKGNSAESGGNILVIEEVIGGITYRFKYMHLSSFLVKKGDTVTPGQIIATSGGREGSFGAGGSTGPHLHLGIFNMSSGSEVAIDPDIFLNKMKDNVKRQQDQQTTTPVPAENIENDQIMRDVAKYSDVITKLAKAQGVDVDVAKIYVAVDYHYSKDNVGTKSKIYSDEEYINSLLENLQDVDLTFMWKKSTMFSYLGAQQVSKISQLAQKKINETQSKPTSQNSEPTFNAYSSTDKRTDYNKNLFPTFSETLSTLNKFSQTQSVVSTTAPWKNFEATAYIATCPGCTGITRTGLDVRDTSKEYHVIAVDPNVIPLYSLVEIQGPKGVSGVYRALDTGGDIKGNRIDILMSTYNKAISFGREQIKVRIIQAGKSTGDTQPYLRPVKYASTNPISYPVPPQGEDYRTFIQSNPGSIDPNIICAIIDASSDWRPSFQRRNNDDTVVRQGLMGLPGNYTNSVGDSVNWLDGNRSIEFGSKFLAHCLSLLNNKLTVSLAAYFIGDPVAISNIATTKTKTLDYLKMKTEIDNLDNETSAFVEEVMSIYLEVMHGDYIVGDPHKDFGTVAPGLNYDRVSTLDTNIDEFSNKQLIQMSEEERRFKMQLTIVEQRLIRYDSNIMAGNSSLGLANEFIQKFAKYTMQLHRASTHSIGVESVVGLPLIRPGLNIWIEPSRSNLVAYVTGVTHQGNYSQGCFTSIRAEFVRTPSTYKEIDESIFIGERHASSADFGPVVREGEMDAIRKTLIDLNNNIEEVADDAFNINTLQELYNSPAASKSGAYITEWNGEYTKEELEGKINVKYAAAPPIVKKRIAELGKVIDESEDFFINKLLTTLK